MSKPTGKKNGRPKLPSTQTRIPFQVRLSAQERAILIMACQRQGMELSTWMRFVVMQEARRLVAS